MSTSTSSGINPGSPGFSIPGAGAPGQDPGPASKKSGKPGPRTSVDPGSLRPGKGDSEPESRQKQRGSGKSRSGVRRPGSKRPPGSGNPGSGGRRIVPRMPDPFAREKFAQNPNFLAFAARGPVKTPSCGQDYADTVHSRKQQFVLSIAEHANIGLACLSAGWTVRNTAYASAKEDPDFKALWAEAMEVAMDALEHQARERAMGWLEPVFNKDGEEVGFRRCYSDKMMEMLLKAHRPDKFRETVEHEVNHGGGVILIPQPLTEAEFEKIAFEQQKRHREVVSEQ